ncbi:MAG: hypothetical protein JWQ89_3860, partial [Devosia sp.]|nr:hypothetical protein [Devosia sp.]
MLFVGEALGEAGAGDPTPVPSPSRGRETLARA